MAEDFEFTDEQGLIRQFEEMWINQLPKFWDVESFEIVIDYYLRHQQLEKARQACEWGLEQHPYSAELMFQKAQLLNQLERSTEALELVEYLENLHPQDLDTQFLKELIFLRLGDYEAALETLQAMLEWDEAQDEIYTRIGYVYQTMGKMPEAIASYKRAITLNNAQENAVFELNYCWDINQELEKNLVFYQKFTDKDPYSPYAWYNLGLALVKLDKYEDALQAFDYASLIQEDFTKAYFEMGNIYMNRQNYREAQNSYTQVLNFGEETPDLLCCLGAAYEKQSDFVSAMINYKAAIKLDKQWDEAWYGMGMCLFAQKKWYEALHYFKNALKISPENDFYWLAMGDTEYHLGNLVTSIEAYEKSAELYSYNPDLWLNWSLVYLDQGDYEKAIDIIEEGIEECPEEAILYYRSAAYWLVAGNYQEAMDILEQALLLNYDLHSVLYEFFPDMDTQKALYKIIKQFNEETENE